jgi:Flp pilus assembly protein TadG
MGANVTVRSCRLPSVAARLRRDERGQAAVELALALPLVVMFVLAVLQVGLVARDQLAIEYVAREAARAAAVSADPSTAAASAADRVTELAPLDVSTSVGGDIVRVRVRYVSATDVALIGSAIGDVTLEATAAMAWEPP